MTTDFDKYAEPAEHQCPKCGAAPDERWDCCQTHAATAAVNAYGAGQADAVADAGPFQWKCNCCNTVFTSPQRERARPPAGHEYNAGPGCPTCKAEGQYTYRFLTHEGDPCRHCGTAHDDVSPGPCVPAHPPAASARIAEPEAEVARLKADNADLVQDVKHGANALLSLQANRDAIENAQLDLIVGLHRKIAALAGGRT